MARAAASAFMRVLAVVWMGLLVAPQAVAQSDETGLGLADPYASLTFRGFGTLGVARSSSGQAAFVRDLSQPKGIGHGDWSARIDSILGGQVNWEITSDVSLVGQAVSRLRYNGKRVPEMTSAYMRWEARPDLNVRLGRLGADFMMLADSRLVGYASLTARPSADFFGPLFFHHFDGVDVGMTQPLARGLARIKVFVGATHEKAYDIQGIWNTSGSQVSGVVADYWQGGWQLRMNYAQIKFANNLNVSPLPGLLMNAGSLLALPSAISAAHSLETKNRTSRFYSVGVVYESNGLQAQGMANCIRHEAGLLQNSCAGYALVGYRQGTLTPYAGVSAWKSTARGKTTGLPEVPPLSSLNATFNAVMDMARADQRTYTLGARWDVKPNLAIKLQWDAIRGDRRSVFPVRNEQADWNGKTNVISIVSDFLF